MSKNKAKGLVPMTEVLPFWSTRNGFLGWLPMRGMDDMKVEEFREDGAVVVRAELPGVDPDKDIDLTMKDGVLRIHAQRTQQSEHEDDSSYRSEFSYGSVTRRVPMPSGVSSADVKASYHDGILEVRVPLLDGEGDVGKIAVQRS